ncbi:MAG: hypothetical protein IPN19_06405 [Elusimicrobia bacterium]|nr:hypothetical protein [Elusimicrobiota bacterium]
MNRPIGEIPKAVSLRRIRTSSDARPPSPTALFESLSESRISVLYLARQAKEGKNTDLAKRLTAQGQSLRQEITRIRQTATAVWTKETQSLIAQAGTAQSELAKLIKDADKSAKKTKAFARALAAVSNVLALAKKAI